MQAATLAYHRYRWLIFWILAAGYILVYFHRLCPAVVAVDMMKDLKTSGALTGFLAAAYFYPYAVMQLPAGLLSDSWGPRNTITFFFIVAIVGSLMLGMAPSVFWAIFGRALVGLGVAMLFVPTMKILAEWFAAAEFALMTSILMAMGGIGSLTATTPMALFSSRFGWRAAFLTVGALTLVLTLLVWRFVRDRPADMGWSAAVVNGTGQQAPTIGLLQGVQKVLGCGYFWPLAIWFFFDAGIFFTFGGLWGGPYLIQVYGMSKSQAGQVLSLFAIGLIVGSPLQGFLSNKVFRARKPVIALSSLIVVGLTAALAFYTERIPIPGLYLICLGLGVFSSSTVVVAFTATKELFPIQIAGTATGLVNLFPFAGGAVLQPVLGWVLEQHGRVNGAFVAAGYRQAFGLLFASALIALLSSLFLKETMASRKRARSD
jgi:sugar phosphate permease